ncbi:MAG: ABC transporter substrate-binding protein [Alphaproteobacteria bacterium]|nr:ABC transporter substrate-binding protein [Alphaproteobacteria bacterium]
MRTRTFIVALACAVAAATGHAAETLRVGMAVETTALDPHFHSTTPNAQVARHIFDPLVAQDATQALQPGLALSWRMIEPTRWRLALRPGVRFQDGQEFGAEDVVVSLKRAVAVEGSPGGYGSYLRAIVDTVAIDPLTVEIRTSAPHPALPWDLTAIAIVSRRAAGARPDAFNDGTLAIGTGPFRLLAWRRGEGLDLARNDGWWGPAPAWSRVALRPIPKDAARVAALLAGDVDLIEGVPTSSLADLSHRRELRLAQAVTSRVLFLALDSDRDPTPFVTDAEGRPLSPNPLRDARVRRAISLAVDRAAITERIMEGAATPAAQLLPATYVGTSRRLVPDRYDPDAARRLLAEAGYPRGFTVTLHGPNGRYLNDEKVTIAIAGMLQRVGIVARVASLPGNLFKARAAKREFSLFMDGWSTETGDAGLAMRALLATADPRTGWGSNNRAGYSNPAFDAALGRALATTEDAPRAAALAQAIEVAMDDAGMLPLYFQSATWASRAAVAYEARSDEYTLAVSARPAP